MLDGYEIRSKGKQMDQKMEGKASSQWEIYTLRLFCVRLHYIVNRYCANLNKTYQDADAVCSCLKTRFSSSLP